MDRRERNRNICALYRQGRTAVQIAKKFQLSEIMIRRILRAEGVRKQRKRPDLTPAQIEARDQAICREYAAGVIGDDLCKEHFLTWPQLRRILEVGGVRHRGRAEAARAVVMQMLASGWRRPRRRPDKYARILDLCINQKKNNNQVLEIMLREGWWVTNRAILTAKHRYRHGKIHWKSNEELAHEARRDEGSDRADEHGGAPA